MKGLILSGGNGVRMRPLSLYSAKQLLPVLNKPVLFHNIELLLSAGILDIGIIVGPMKKQVIEEIDRSEYRKKANLYFIEQPEPQGLAHAVSISRSFLQADDFVMVLGDNLFTDNLNEIVSTFETTNPESLIALTYVTEPSRYGIAIVEEDQVLSVQEKPQSPLSNWALAGLYVFRPTIHAIIEKLKPSDRGEYEITDVIQYQIESGKSVKPCFLEGYWRDIGTPKDLLETNMDSLKNSREKTEKIRTVFSTVVHPVWIHKTAVVLNSEIGPNVIIGPNALIKNATLKNSVVLADTIVTDINKNNCIISPWGIEEVKISD